jgi:hypothetical protein
MSHDGSDKDPLEVLRELPSLGAPHDFSENLRRRARGEMLRGMEESSGERALRVSLQVLVPVGLTATVIGYLAWAVEAATALTR